MMTDSQDMIVLRHMQKHKTITSMQAFDLYGCTRLSAGNSFVFLHVPKHNHIL